MQRTQLEIVILSALVHVKQLKPIETIAWHLNDISTIIFFNCPNWTLKQRLSCSFSCVTHNPSSPKELMSGNPDDSQGVRLTDIHHHSVETEKQIYPHWVCQSPLLSFDRVEMWWSTHLEKWHGHVVTLQSWRLSHWASQCEKAQLWTILLNETKWNWFMMRNKRTTVTTVLIR